MRPDRHPSTGADARPRNYPRWLFAVICGAVALHLNYWMWGADRLVLGLPINLFYHVVLTLALSIVMIALVRRAWPAFLEEEDRE